MGSNRREGIVREGGKDWNGRRGRTGTEDGQGFIRGQDWGQGTGGKEGRTGRDMYTKSEDGKEGRI